MKFIADFHIHSHYSLATSKKLTPEYLSLWGQIKGIGAIGTGDCIHPGWFGELESKLKQEDNGLFTLKGNDIMDPELPTLQNSSLKPHFMLTAEISSIYKKNGRVRKVHNICVFPDFKAAKKVQSKLAKIGNISSDGRPILGLDSRDLLEMVLESSEKSFLIPAHIWTPWFSVLGSKSGFDSLEECYEDLTPYIFAVETGLSSDPPMNRVCSFLDNVRLVSNSDAHSPEKLGREANIFDTDFSYNGIYNSLKQDEGFLGTIEFFPEEGKYFYDGHRKCNVRLNPLESIKNRNICPVCEKPMTLGVMYRVAELADRKDPSEFKSKQNFWSITALPDIIAEIKQKRPNTKTVRKEYFNMIENIGSEFHILLEADLQQIKEIAGDVMCEAIRRLRAEETIIFPGYDGEFGTINLFKSDEIKHMQTNLIFPETKQTAKSNKSNLDFDIDEFRQIKDMCENETEIFNKNFINLNTTQKKASRHKDGAALITGGPGTGKTKVITERIITMTEKSKIQPKSILLFTFSEYETENFKKAIAFKNPKSVPNIESFEKFGLAVLKKHASLLGRKDDFIIIEDEDKQAIVNSLIPDATSWEKEDIIDQIAGYKEGFYSYNEINPLIKKYEDALLKLNAIDKQDLIFLPLQIFLSNPNVIKKYRRKYYWIMIDDYQNINKNQQRILELLADTEDRNIFATADLNQTVADNENNNHYFIDRFEQKYPDGTKIHLSKSYRLCPKTVKAAKKMFTQNLESFDTDKQEAISLQECGSENDEAAFICSRIKELCSKTDETETVDKSLLGQTAVLMRNASMFTAITNELNKNEIPYRLITSEPKHKKNPICQPLNHFRKIFYGQELDTNNEDLPVNVEIKELIKQNKNITLILRRLSLLYNIKATDTEYLHNISAPFKNNYNAFFTYTTLDKGIDGLTPDSGCVTLMTLDAAKGTEFKNVFLAGCNEGFIPFEMFGKKTDLEIQLEERLFYVGLTRSYDQLTISYTQKRNFNDNIIYPSPSRFMEKIPVKAQIKADSSSDETPKDKQLTLFEL